VTPILFLDVDGVMSPMGGPSAAWNDWEKVTLNGYRLVLSRAMAQRLADLPVEIVWLTSWRQRANTHIGSWLGWPTHEVVDPGDAADPLYWKLFAVQAHIDKGGDTFVWIDDDLWYMAPLLVSTAANHPHLLIAPDWCMGLTPEHLDSVERFLREPQDA
jgi:hypothetical protein